MPIAFADFKERVGQKLGVIATGESLSAEDGALIGEKALVLQEEIAEIVSVDFGDDLDDKYADILVEMVAAMCVDEFEVPEQRAVRMRLQGMFGLSPASQAEVRLRKLVALPASDDVTKTNYF